MKFFEKISEVFEEYRERPFLIEAFSGRQFTYGEFYQLACKAAQTLRSQGIRRHHRVAMVLPNSAEFAALYFGCLFLGAVAVPINPALHPREVTFILANSAAKLVIYSTTTKKSILDPESLNLPPGLCLETFPDRGQEAHDGGVPYINLHAALDLPDWKPMAGVSGDDLFSLTFTSGTTSLPKGVAHKISSLLENAAAFNAQLGFDHHHRFLHIMPMGYMAGFLNTLLCPFMAGASVVLDKAFEAQTVLHFWQPVINYEVNAFWLAPTMVAALLRLDRDLAGLEYCRNHVKAICVGTAPLPLKIRKDFEQKYGVKLLESYGLSELLLVASNSNPWPVADGSVGRLLPGIALRILNADQEGISRDADGEIWVKTPYMMAGYLNYQTFEPEPFDPADWFPTGDLGHLEGDYLFITGRKKDLIIRGGINISPRAIEELLLEHEAVDQVAVIGLPDDFYGEEVAAVVKFKPGYTLAAVRAALEGLCREKFSTAAVPTKFFELAGFPLSSLGKVQKAKLREMFSSPASLTKA